MISRLLDLLLGPTCSFGCGQRVYAKDETGHERLEHAGDL